MPLFSVIIPTYNRAELLKEAASSILDQSFGDFELIIVDDCSTDETSQVVEEMRAEDDRVRVLKTEANGGCNRARNLGLDVARGRYVAFLDDDDVALSERLELSLRSLEKHDSAGVVSVGYRFIDVFGNERPQDPGRVGLPAGVIGPDDLFGMLYCDWTWFPTSTLAFRASVFERHRYPDFRRPDGDSVLLSRMAALGESLVFVPDVAALMRRDRRYHYMSRDRFALLLARRETLIYLRSWLREQGITRFDHLHRGAWSNHLLREAKTLGGFRGLARVFHAFTTNPGNSAAFKYVVRWLRRSILGR